MPAFRFDNKDELGLNAVTYAADAQLVSRMRLVLAVSVLLAVLAEPSGLSASHVLTWLVFAGYLSHSTVIYIWSQMNNPLVQGRLIHRLDVIWFSLIVTLTGGVDSFFFPFFFFAILVSSFRWGLEEGAKVTIASAILFLAGALLLEPQHNISQLLMRTIFLLGIGYLSVTWGESKLRLMRQLVLLRDVSHLSNPRFGVDQTIANLLEKTRLFYRASSCILVMHDKSSGAYFLRTAKEGIATQSIRAQSISEEAGAPLVAQSRRHLIAYSRPLWPALRLGGGEAVVYETGQHRWFKQKGTASENLAGLLEARGFMSAPVELRDQRGRLYVVSDKSLFSRADTLFLVQIAAQTFPVIENIELLDNMVFDAAMHERQKISLDIHDITIQPYIGLKLGLNAIRHKAADDNPVTADIDKLTVMVESVIDDLRKYAGTFKDTSAPNGPVLMKALQDQANGIKRLYGIDITICMDSNLTVSDRLTAEVLQLVRESLSNICKHTMAQSGLVSIECVDGWLKLQVENENTSLWSSDFMPRSISERAAGLGGSVQVTHGLGGNTSVLVEIPV